MKVVHMAAMQSGTAPLPPPALPAPETVALFLDMDGTLVSFAATPDAVTAPPAAGDKLNRLAERLGGALAVVSGRRLAELDLILKPGSFAAAGLHGLEHRARPAGPIDGPSGDTESVARWRDLFAPLLKRYPALLLEEKVAGVALHYRADPSLAEPVRTAAEAALAAGPKGYHLLDGNHVVEIKPAGRGKGDAVTRFLAAPPFKGRVPVFIGDDVTDEDGFRTARAAGGFGIVVGDRRPTLATAALPDVASVWAWLDRLADAPA